MEKLYMIEVLVNSVVFDELPVPLKKNIVIHASCPIVGSIEIRTDVMGSLENLETKERSAKRKDVDINCGHSLLFLIDPKSLRDVLKKPLEISVMTKDDIATPIGTVLMPWGKAFQDMVESSIMGEGYITPVGIEDVLAMSRDGQHSAEISVFIRLSFLGRSIYTNIQRLASKDEARISGAPGGPATPIRYLVKSEDNATIFECKRYGMGTDSDFTAVGALYNAANLTGPPPAAAPAARPSMGSKSTATLLSMRGTIGSTTSMTPSVFFGMGAYDRTAMIQSVLSMADTAIPLRMDKGKQSKFLDLTELHMDVSTFSMLANAMGMHIYHSSGSIGDSEEEGEGGVYPMFVDYKSLTVEEIEQRLCKHPDCPAAKLFKEFGIGPLAKNISGLGGLYDDVQAPCAYGLSHCNGTIDDYGPLGRFKRPKKAEEPFVPQSNCKCARKSSTVSTTSTGSNTLSKGSKSKTKGKTECYQHCPMNPLRLKGGAPPGPPCDPLPNPVTLCQDLMEEFNKVLKDYKDALGPCGKATCPFALNMVEDACTEICNSSDPEYRKRICELTDPAAVMEEKDEFTGCGVPNCPYKRAAISPAERDFSKFRGMPGCGYTKCPFVKAKLGMEPEEDEHLPPFKDYEKQETYKYTDDLPPIHWDCPDPLPKGDCTNPDCPFVKRDALIKKYFPEPCCPCGSPACPYVCAPCTFPGCPFHIAEACPPVCPYTEPPPKQLKCTPSVCPFVRNTEARCENPDCPYKIYEDKLAECAQWERQQALLAELAAEEEEVDEPCKRCGRGKSKRARCSKGNSMSMSRIESAVKPSGIVDVERASDPCILSAAVEKRGAKSVPCKPGTCGVGENVCGVCKSNKNEKADKAKDQKQGELKVKPAVEEKATDTGVIKVKESKVAFHDGKERLKGPETVSGGILKKPAEANKKKKSASRVNQDKQQKQPQRKLVGGKTTTKAAMSPIVPRPVVDTKRPFPFRIDRETYKPSKMIGHGDCVLPKFLVPKRMGWLWNIHENICGLRPRKGWKPGAVSKMIAFRIDYYKALADNSMKKKPKVNLLNVKPSQPTVQINKKGGVVNVTMHPVKEPAEIYKAGDGNPYIDCSPIQFKITKNEKDKEIKYCYCGDQLSESESSQLDIEFSPPAALKNPLLMHKHALLEQEVQYNIDDVPLPPEKSKNGSTWLSEMFMRVCDGLPKTIRGSYCRIDVQTDVLGLRCGGVHGVPAEFWKRFISWKFTEKCLSLRILFLSLIIKFVEGPGELSHRDLPSPPILRLRGGADSFSSPRMSEEQESPEKSRQQSRKLKLPKSHMPSAFAMCQDLMDDYNRVMTNYKNALGPCGTATCPLNYNVLEDKCKKVCQVTCQEPYCPPKVGPCEKPLCPRADFDEYEGEECPIDEYKACYESCVAPRPDGTSAVPCGRSTCPFTVTTPDLCPTWECPNLEECNVDTCIAVEDVSKENKKEPCMLQDPLKLDIKCNKHICPYKRDQLTVDDVNPFYKKVRNRKGCGSPFCPQSNKYVVEPEVVPPAFPCKRPCPSLDDLPPIHWDCPDPLPTGECTNPFCPFREKLPCGHCPIDARHCGMPGCQFAGDDLCPPTCPYTQKNPPTELECRPSVCPLVRPLGYRKPPFVPRSERPCAERCPYADGNSKKKTCGNPKCPYATCIDRNGLETKDVDCGNPMCPYRIAVKKMAEKEKQRAKEKDEFQEILAAGPAKKVASPPKTETTTARAVSLSGSKHSLNRSTTAEVSGKASATVKASGTKISNHNYLKMIQSSMQALKDAPEADSADVCCQVSCAQFLGDRLCKKCLQKQREAEAAGTDLLTLATKKEQSPKSGKRTKSAKQKKKKKHRGYVYNKGTYYPGVKFGHKGCSHRANRVPWDMGWRWNIHQPYEQLKQRRGWRPGAIGRTMLKFINAERKKLGLPPRPMLNRPMPTRHAVRSHSDEMIANVRRTASKKSHMKIVRHPKPTLTVKKKDGVVYVTMHPLKDPKDLGEHEYPYIDCSPLEFKITKKKPDDEFKKCLCSGDNSDEGSSEEESSDLDIEFTPPAGIVRPEVIAKHQHICHSEVQYDKNDIPKSETDLKKKKKGKKGKKDANSKKGGKGTKKK